MMRKILEHKQEIVGDVSYDLNFPLYHKRSHYLLNLPSLHPPGLCHILWTTHMLYKPTILHVENGPIVIG